jgi:hypothetical protein
MASGHLLLSCAKRAATTKIDLFAYLWQLPCALCSLNLNDIAHRVDKQRVKICNYFGWGAFLCQ